MNSRGPFFGWLGLGALALAIGTPSIASQVQRSLEDRVANLERRLDRLEDYRDVEIVYEPKLAGDWKVWEVGDNGRVMTLRRQGEMANEFIVVNPAHAGSRLSSWDSDKLRIGRSSNARYPYLLVNTEHNEYVEAIFVQPR